MVKIIKEEIEINEQLKKKVIWACSFNNTSPIIKKGSLLELVPTNVAYVEHHRITINDKLYLLFNGCNYAFIGNLNNKIKLSEINSYIINCNIVFFFNYYYNLIVKDSIKTVSKWLLSFLNGRMCNY